MVSLVGHGFSASKVAADAVKRGLAACRGVMTASPLAYSSILVAHSPTAAFLLRRVRSQLLFGIQRLPSMD